MLINAPTTPHLSPNGPKCPQTSTNVPKCPQTSHFQMSQNVLKCPKTSQNVPKCPILHVRPWKFAKKTDVLGCDTPPFTV